MPQKIILVLEKIKAAKPYGEKSIDIRPYEDLLFETEISETQYHKDENGRIILNCEGLRKLLNDISFILYVDSSESTDF